MQGACGNPVLRHGCRWAWLSYTVAGQYPILERTEPLFGRSLRALCVLAALLVAAPVVLCAPRQAARDCCQGEQRAPCGVPDSRPRGAQATGDCCFAAPDTAIAAAVCVQARPGPRYAAADKLQPDPGFSLVAAGAAEQTLRVGGSIDDGWASTDRRPLYLRTRRLRL